MLLNKIISFKYGIDKLHIKFSNYAILKDCIDSLKDDLCEDYKITHIKTYLSYKMYELRYCDELLGILSFKESDYVILEVDNRLLYSDGLEKVYLFAHRFCLEFQTFSKFEMYCDSNVDLPGKLNRLLRSGAYDITRRRVTMLNERGNLDLGVKIIPNIVFVEGERERRYPTYNFTPLKTSGCGKCPVKLVGYNKSVEVACSSHKQYILDALPFGDDVVHRLEIRTCGYEMMRNGVNSAQLFYNLNNEDSVKVLFIGYLNRFFEFNKDGRKHTASELLRMTKQECTRTV